MRQEPMLTWEEVYQQWKLYSLFEPAVLSEPMEPVEIPIPWKGDGCFYGYDWLSRKQLEDRKELIEKDLVQFLYFTQATNKGTIHTLKMLLEARDEEERAAIWIYAFASELYESKACGNAGRIAWKLCIAARQFLGERFGLWHHAMKKLVPEFYVNQTLISETKFDSFKPLVELARLNAALVLHEYVPVLYTSLEPGARKEDDSVRLAENR